MTDSLVWIVVGLVVGIAVILGLLLFVEPFQPNFVKMGNAIKWCEENIDNGWGKKGYPNMYLECYYPYQEIICTDQGIETKTIQSTIKRVDVTGNTTQIITHDNQSLQLKYRIDTSEPLADKLIVFEEQRHIYKKTIIDITPDEYWEWQKTRPNSVHLRESYLSTIDKVWTEHPDGTPYSYPSHGGGSWVEDNLCGKASDNSLRLVFKEIIQ